MQFNPTVEGLQNDINSLQSEITTKETEVNALYERLLQEMESKSEPLEQEVQAVQSITSGRDY